MPKNKQEFVPYSKWLHQHDEQIKEKYPDRMTDAMADEYGVNYYTVVRRANRMGRRKSSEFMRSHWSSGGKKQRGSKRDKLTQQTKEYMKARFHDTANGELARLFGVDVKTVRRWARLLGLVKSDEFMRRARGRPPRGYYTQEHKEWIRGRIAEVYPTADREGLQQLAGELGLKLVSLKSLAQELGIRRAPEAVNAEKKRSAMERAKYSPEFIEELRAFYPDHTNRECEERFGIPARLLAATAHNHGISKSREHINKVRRMTSDNLLSGKNHKR